MTVERREISHKAFHACKFQRLAFVDSERPGKKPGILMRCIIQSRARSLSLAALPRHINCCVEAECHFCYLRDSGLYVHESCRPGNQRHLPTYAGCRRFWYGPLAKYGS